MSEELLCVWDLGTPCSGEVEIRPFFNKEAGVPVCDAHVEQHRCILFLFHNGYDIEKVVDATPEWRKKQMLTLVLAGISPEGSEE